MFGRLLRAKWGPVPVWVIVVGLLVVAYIVVKRRNAAASATGTDASGGTAYGSDSSGGYGYSSPGGVNYPAGGYGAPASVGPPPTSASMLGSAYGQTAQQPAASQQLGPSAGAPTFQGAFLGSGQSGQVPVSSLGSSQLGTEPSNLETQGGSTVVMPGVPMTRAGIASALSSHNSITQPTGAATSTYTVAKGDTWSSIAAKFGISTTRLTALNPTAVRPIRPGERLKVPTSGQIRTSAAASVGGTSSNPTSLARLRTAI